MSRFGWGRRLERLDRRLRRSEDRATAPAGGSGTCCRAAAGNAVGVCPISSAAPLRIVLSSV